MILPRSWTFLTGLPYRLGARSKRFGHEYSARESLQRLFPTKIRFVIWAQQSDSLRESFCGVERSLPREELSLRCVFVDENTEWFFSVSLCVRGGDFCYPPAHARRRHLRPGMFPPQPQALSGRRVSRRRVSENRLAYWHARSSGSSRRRPALRRRRHHPPPSQPVGKAETARTGRPHRKRQ